MGEARRLNEGAVAWPRSWYPACRSQNLGRTPLARQVLGQRLVLFRDPQGKPAALTDRCPHRHLPLSMGRCRDGQLQCAYHGWRFDAQGHCQHVPGLAAGQSMPRVHLPRWPAQERNGLVWLWPFAEVPPSAMPADHHGARLGDVPYQHVWLSYRMAAPWQAVVENILDVPHTAFVHGGLFRQPTMQRSVQVRVAVADGSLEATFAGEPPPSGLLGRWLAPGGGEVRHWDRFFWPATAQVEYRLGDMHWLGTHWLTPEDPQNTTGHVVVSGHLPGPAGRLTRPLLAGLVQAVGRALLWQDGRVLRAQAAALSAQPMASTPLDALSLGLRKLMAIEREDEARATLQALPEQRFVMQL